ncbi:plasmid replication protein RepC [Ciceribacter thiooxidans]
MTLALLKGQLDSANPPAHNAVDKWHVFRDISEARTLLGLGDRALAILHALLSFYPEQQLGECGRLVVFPSNAQLSIRAHGIAGSTLRRHLAALVDAGIVIRKDSPNGKRFARKDSRGAIEQAYGFSLAPLLTRAEEFAQLAQRVATERQRLRVLRERFSLARRDVAKLMSAAIAAETPGGWQALEQHYSNIASKVGRVASADELTAAVHGLEELRVQVVKLLEIHLNSQVLSANDRQNERHIENPESESIYESEEAVETTHEEESTHRSSPTEIRPTTFPLSFVLRACPDIAMYGQGGVISSWRDLISAAVVVRSMLGVSPSAYQEASEAMGPENAAIVMACILERAGHINTAGGYLRDLTAKARRGVFSVGPMLSALVTTRCEGQHRPGSGSGESKPAGGEAIRSSAAGSTADRSRAGRRQRA